MNVESVLTHDQLANSPGLGAAALANLLSKSFGGSSTAVREEALRQVLKTLSRRTPPIYEEDISDPTELTDAVRYGSLAIIYEAALTTAGPDSPFEKKRKLNEDRFKAELQGLQITTSSGARTPGMLGIPMERR